MKSRKINGSLFLEEIKFSEVIEKKVISNNQSSSKITLPKDWEGKEVIVLLKNGK